MDEYRVNISPEVRRWVIKNLNNEQARRLGNKLDKLRDYPDIYMVSP